jgi:hypothetical protein
MDRNEGWRWSSTEINRHNNKGAYISKRGRENSQTDRRRRQKWKVKERKTHENYKKKRERKE